jgi:hypothetical protein
MTSMPVAGAATIRVAGILARMPPGNLSRSIEVGS